MQSSAHLLQRKLRKVACLHSESRDISDFRLRVFRVPIPRYLGSVFFVQDWIKDWLPRKTRWEGAAPGFRYETKLVRSNRAIENCGLFHSCGADSRKLGG